MIDDQIEDMTTNSFINDNQTTNATGGYIIDFVLKSIIVIRNNSFCAF